MVDARTEVSCAEGSEETCGFKTVLHGYCNITTIDKRSRLAPYLDERELSPSSGVDPRREKTRKHNTTFPSMQDPKEENKLDMSSTAKQAHVKVYTHSQDLLTDIHDESQHLARCPALPVGDQRTESADVNVCSLQPSWSR